MNVKLTRGLAAAAVSAAMMLGAAVPALAQGVGTDSKVNLGVTYSEKGDGVAPTETVTYSQTAKTSSDNATYKPNGKTEIPDLGIAAATVSDDAKSGNVVLTVPTYTAVGKYTYTLTRTAINAAGVTDNAPTTITVVVTVENNEDGTGFNKYVNIFNGPDTSDTNKKITNVDLEYASGKLMVKKQVAGNLGDTTGNTKFDFKVTLSGPADKDQLNGTYHYVVNGDTDNPKEIVFTNGKAELSDKLGHNDYITFTDLPAGVTYAVSELNDSKAVSKDGDAEHDYKLTDITTTDNGTASTIDADKTDSEVYTNTKSVTNVDTGVLLNNAPYIAIIGGAAVVAIYVVNKRRHSDMD